jgi:methylglutaconyl-CoA hydratase
MTETAETIILERSGPVATLRLNRPQRHNAFDETMIAALRRTLRELRSDADTRMLAIRAEGPTFCAGADLEWMRRAADQGPEANYRDAMDLAELLLELDNLPKPTVALVQGPAYGGGVGLLACCDLVIAEASARFALTEVRLGLIPAAISPYLMQTMGARATRHYALSGAPFDAERALQLGLVTELVSAGDLDAALARTRRRLLANGPAAMAACKTLLAELRDLKPSQETAAHTARAIARIRAGEEARSGIGAFLRRAPAEWSTQ